MFGGKTNIPSISERNLKNINNNLNVRNKYRHFLSYSLLEHLPQEQLHNKSIEVLKCELNKKFSKDNYSSETTKRNLIVNSKSKFLIIKDKNEGVEKGFFGRFMEEKDIFATQNNQYEKTKKFNLAISSIIKWLYLNKEIKDDNGIAKNLAVEIYSKYLKFLYENDKIKNEENILKSIDELVDKVKCIEGNILLYQENIGSNLYEKIFIKKLEEAKNKYKGDSIEIIPSYIVKGDRAEFLNISLCGTKTKDVARAVFQDKCANTEESNKEIIKELLALKLAKLFGCNTPNESYLVTEKYSNQKLKLMLASSLYKDFIKFDGLLYNIKTGKEQEPGKNYNRLSSKRGTVRIDRKLSNKEKSEIIELKDLSKNIMVFAILNDLDGLGAQAQNVAMNSEGELLFFDFGHSFSKNENLGTTFIPQLGKNENVKSRNISSFFSGVSLYEQLKAFKDMTKKVKNIGEGKIFQLNREEEINETFEDLKINLKENLPDKESKYYTNHLDTIKTYFLERMDYINNIFKNRLNLLEEENGEFKINLLDNLQLLIFRGKLTKYSSNGIVLKEGTSYFDMCKKVNGKYEISLKGKSFYGKDKKYKKGFSKLVKSYFKESNKFEFSEKELLEFSKFLIKEKSKKVSKLKKSNITTNIKSEEQHNDELIMQSLSKEVEINQEKEYFSDQLRNDPKSITTRQLVMENIIIQPKQMCYKSNSNIINNKEINNKNYVESTNRIRNSISKFFRKKVGKGFLGNSRSA
ncbi:MAG TPA: hypothetical protein VLL98_02700 [Rickettsiales bacterium]|nr:hypothetical protein [Rickettsiales bacterium]